MSLSILITLSMLITHAIEPRCAPYDGRKWRTCRDVAEAARAERVPVGLAVTLAWSESRLDASQVSPVGAAGPLQVIPRYWCPGGRAAGCDLARAGARALRILTSQHGVEDGLCHYAAGNVCSKRARKYARMILARVREQENQ